MSADTRDETLERYVRSAEMAAYNLGVGFGDKAAFKRELSEARIAIRARFAAIAAEREALREKVALIEHAQANGWLLRPFVNRMGYVVETNIQNVGTGEVEGVEIGKAYGRDATIYDAIRDAMGEARTARAALAKEEG